VRPRQRAADAQDGGGDVRPERPAPGAPVTVAGLGMALGVSTVFAILRRLGVGKPGIAELLEVDLDAFNSIWSAVQDLGVFQIEDSNVVTGLSFLTELAAVHDGVIACLLEEFCQDAGRYIVLGITYLSRRAPFPIL